MTIRGEDQHYIWWKQYLSNLKEDQIEKIMEYPTLGESDLAVEHYPSKIFIHYDDGVRYFEFWIKTRGDEKQLRHASIVNKYIPTELLDDLIRIRDL